MFSVGEIVITDRNSDNRIDHQDVAASRTGDDAITEPTNLSGTTVRVGETTFTIGQNETWEQFLNRIEQTMAQAASAPEPAAARTELQSLNRSMSSINNQISQLETELNNPSTPENRQQEIREQLQELRQQLQQQIQRAEFLNQQVSRGDRVDIPSEYYSAAEMEQPGANGRNTAAMTTGGSQGSQPRAQTTGRSAGFTPPMNWGAQTGMPAFNSSAYMQSMAMEDSILSSYDSVLQTTSRGRQLMMMFFHFAKMAESGDMGAMYQFMKFITYVISKDKAKQQIDMGRKLIELQDTSRKYTDMLMNQQTDASDPNSSNEFMKTMTLVKSETDSIATSQKLISNMMEEMAMVVENLTSVTKGALDAYGRILRTVSRMGG
ncbi:MAG: hypothetical protein ABH859_02875 [Pseudomonadota bacterium]